MMRRLLHSVASPTYQFVRAMLGCQLWSLAACVGIAGSAPGHRLWILLLQ